MSIEVILREHVEHLGNRGEVVKVADGYARNSASAQARAESRTKQAPDRARRAKAEVRESEERTLAVALVTRARGPDLQIGRRVGENDTRRLGHHVGHRGAPGARLHVDRRKMRWPIRSRHWANVVPIRLHRDVTANVKVRVVPA
jgi:large subunit ribosomal protein L9